MGGGGGGGLKRKNTSDDTKDCGHPVLGCKICFHF